jgi:putative ATP-dependent endonuclease of the OLD family
MDVLQRLDDPQVIEDALEQIRGLQQPILDQLSERITETLKIFLPKIKACRIEIDNSSRMRAVSSNVTLIVDDGEPTPISRKGDGVQSLATLALARAPIMRTDFKGARVLAIEEPEAHLHPKAVRELKKVLSTMAEGSQIIISTHSPIFANRNNVMSNIIVDGRKAIPAKSIVQIRHCLGVEAPDNLMSAELAVLVEGKCDKVFIEAYARQHEREFSRLIASGRVAVVDIGGADKAEYFLKLYQTFVLKTLVLFDNDPAGRDALKNLQEKGLANLGDIFCLRGR